ncbi:MAG: sugar phosphate isomerase/epimerase family protein [Solirubrobacteraceae bacterium]
MSHRYSLAHLTVLQTPPPELIYLADRAGYDSVDLRIIPLGLKDEPRYELASDPQLLRKTKAALAETGLPVNSIELCRIGTTQDWAQYEAAFEVAAELGASQVICSVWSEDQAQAIDAFARVCALGRDYGLTINLEPVAISDVKTVEQATHFLRQTAATNIGLLLDMYHVHRARCDPGAIESVPRDWFHFVHLCDAPAAIPSNEQELRRELREGRLYLGEGGIDVASILSLVPEVIYAIEIPNQAHLDKLGAFEHARRALQTARAYLDRHPVVILH